MIFLEYVWLCINVAQQYISLGRFDLAGSLYAEGLSTLAEPEHAVSSETRAALYLAYAAATAEGGNLEQSLAAYEEATILAEVLSAETHSGPLKPIIRVRSIVRSAIAANTFSTIQENRVSYDPC
jgi:tetratricopeptide (TPR) repeat protein